MCQNCIVPQSPESLHKALKERPVSVGNPVYIHLINESEIIKNLRPEQELNLEPFDYSASSGTELTQNASPLPKKGRLQRALRSLMSGT